MNYQIDLQIACEQTLPVTENELRLWVETALQPFKPRAELTLRLVESEEIRNLNNTYRKKDSPTNVLAFPSSITENIILEYPLLGDIIICPEVLSEESFVQKKSLKAHWAHIVIHGVLHLLDFDHITDEEEAVMQKMEIKLLSQCGFANPYHEEEYHLE